jgi:hypothetical protein
MSARKYLSAWLNAGGNLSTYDTQEIAALPGFRPEFPLLDNVIALGWGRPALAKFEADGRPAFAAFREWAAVNLPGQIDGLKFGDLPGEGVTLVYSIKSPVGCGPDYSARFWGRNDAEAQAKANDYLARLPKNFAADPAVERRIGR